jgi:hypothetical protein
MKLSRFSPTLATSLLLVALAHPMAASAEVRLDGDWPEGPAVTLDLRGVTRAEAIRALAKEAKLSVVMPDLGNGTLDVQVHEQPADKVLGVLLAEGTWVASRDGDLLTIRPATAADRADDEPPAKSKKNRNVEVLADSLRIGPDDVVQDVSVVGGSVQIAGRVTGDLSVIGGSAELLDTAVVEGSVSVTGGRVTLAPGVLIQGDVNVLGGRVEGLDNAKVEGSVKLDPSDGHAKASFGTRAVHRLSEGLRNAALLFIIGSLFTALASERAESLRGVIAARPMKAIAVGLIGFFASLLVLTLVAITIVGIPFAAVGALILVFMVFASTTNALAVVGAAIYGHKSRNVYVHMAIGAALYMLVGLIPGIGPIAQIAAVLAGFGGLVLTKGLGLLPKKIRDSHPFRAVAD